MTLPGSAAAESGPAGCAAGPAQVIVIEAAPEEVRRALARARDGLHGHGPGALGRAETVLAEVLNNIVEHAYARAGRGRIEIRLRHAGACLCADVRDRGAPMPGGALPEGGLPSTEGGAARPPEGGFGWFLIRSLARDIRYSRRGGENRLCFSVPLEEIDAG